MIFISMDKINCEFCGKTISIDKLRLHLKNQHQNKFDSISDMTKYFMNKKFGFSLELINQIICEYENSSVLSIEKMYGFGFRNLLKDLGLHEKTISESRKLKSVHEKQKITNLLKYGYENVSQSPKIKEKKRETFLKNYGVDNIWKTDWYRDWWESTIKKKYGKVCLVDLYGCENYFGWKTMSDDEKKLISKRAYNGYVKWYEKLSDEDRKIYNQKKSNGIIRAGRSKQELKIENILNKNNFYNKPQYWVKNKSYDFHLGGKILLEVNGTYWHCDPRFYKSDDIVKFGEEICLASDVWDKDKKKMELAESYGYKVIYLWENEINKYTDEEIFNNIISLLYEN